MKYIRIFMIRVKQLSRINILRTLYINFHMFRFKEAIHLPIFLYGKIIFHDMTGSIEIKAPIHRGMIKIGFRWFDLVPSAFLPTQIMVSGKLVFNGDCVISGGAAIFIQHKDAILSIGHETSIGGGSLIKSMDILEIGDKVSITSNCTVMNSNMHFVKNVDTGIVQKPWGKIVIGNHCWINSGSVITKGAIIPDYTVTSRNAFMGKDYTECGENAFLVGSPAKAVSTHVQRIFGIEKEIQFTNFFRIDNPNENTMHLSEGVEEDNGRRFSF